MGRRETVEIDYVPRPLQREFHGRTQRFAIEVCHRRFGKTVMVVNDLIRDAIQCRHEQPRVAYIAPLYRQAKAVAWDYVQKYTHAIPGMKYNQAELRADFPNGARFSLYGADNPDSLRGIYLDAAGLDEPAQMSERLWGEIIRPALADRKGRATFIGTPMGHNAFYDLYEKHKSDPEWYTRIHRASETGYVDPAELLAARSQMSEEQYAQEFECSFEAAILGAYYAKELRDAENDGRICPVPVERSALVHVAWDLGVGDSTALVFCQVIGREWRIVDYYEANGVGLDHYVQVLNGKGYTYGDQILPHDVGVRELGTGRSRLEVLGSLGVRNVKVLPATSVDDGINAVRMTLSKCWFDATRCHDLLEALRQYRTEYDDRLKRFKPRPLHDWTSHAADAFRYLCVGLDEYTPPKRQNVEIGGSYAWMG